MKYAIRIAQSLYAAYGLAAGYLFVYIALHAYLFGFNAWVDGAAVTAVVAMLGHQPLQEWSWAGDEATYCPAPVRCDVADRGAGLGPQYRLPGQVRTDVLRTDFRVDGTDRAELRQRDLPT